MRYAACNCIHFSCILAFELINTNFFSAIAVVLNKSSDIVDSSNLFRVFRDGVLDGNGIAFGVLNSCTGGPCWCFSGVLAVSAAPLQVLVVVFTLQTSFKPLRLAEARRNFVFVDLGVDDSFLLNLHTLSFIWRSFSLIGSFIDSLKVLSRFVIVEHVLVSAELRLGRNKLLMGVIIPKLIRRFKLLVPERKNFDFFEESTDMREMLSKLSSSTRFLLMLPRSLGNTSYSSSSCSRRGESFGIGEIFRTLLNAFSSFLKMAPSDVDGCDDVSRRPDLADSSSSTRIGSSFNSFSFWS